MNIAENYCSTLILQGKSIPVDVITLYLPKKPKNLTYAGKENTNDDLFAGKHHEINTEPQKKRCNFNNSRRYAGKQIIY